MASSDVDLDREPVHIVTRIPQQGELPWYFVGRAAERRAIPWLRELSTGLLVVTGAARDR
jgi:hypothetical protein